MRLSLPQECPDGDICLLSLLDRRRVDDPFVHCAMYLMRLRPIINGERKPCMNSLYFLSFPPCSSIYVHITNHTLAHITENEQCAQFTYAKLFPNHNCRETCRAGLYYILFHPIKH